MRCSRVGGLLGTRSFATVHSTETAKSIKRANLSSLVSSKFYGFKTLLNVLSFCGLSP